MPDKMLIDATHPEETRVVVLRGNRVEEFDFESANRKQLRGNIYLAKVTRVEPSLQAAFVDYGGNRHGFLAFSEIHPDYYQIPVADRLALIAQEERDAKAADADADDRAKRGGNGRGGRNRHRRSGSDRPRDPTRSEPVAAEASDPTLDDAGGLTHEALAGLPPEQPALMALPVSEADFPAEPPFQTAEIAAGEASPEITAAAPWTPTDESPVRVSPIQILPEQAPADFEAMSLTPPVPEVDAITTATDSDIGAEAAPMPASFPEGGDDHAETGDEMLLPDAQSAASGDLIAAHDDDSHDDHHHGDEHIDDGDDAHDDSHDDNHDDASDDAHDDDHHEDEHVESVGGADALEEAQERAPRFRRNYKIQEVIKRRQVMLVQVVKEERGTKGAALTTYLSLAGRYSVLMPNTARGGGISRKITSGEDRSRLKEIAQELEVPEGMGVILRTAGASRTKMEVKRDFEYLLRLWETVRDLTLKSMAPMLVYEEGSLVKRSIRDLYSKDIEEIIVAGDEGYKEARDFMRMLMPSHAKNVKPYNDSQPLFTRYGIESQLDAMFQPTVQLRSGGYIVINQTEALVAIDVNSGRATREHHIEDTALKTNCEAADEVARQLRLRDLAGLIVIDFIDMDEGRNNRTVERRMKEALKHDRARIQVGRISHFGLLEMSRQRIRTSVLESSTETCPTCGGLGHVRSVSSVALQLLRAIEDTLNKGATHNVIVRTRSEIALYVLNHKRAHLRALEERFRVTVTVSADPTVNAQVSYIVDRGEQMHTADAAKAIAAAAPPVVALFEEDDYVEPEPELDEDDDDSEGLIAAPSSLEEVDTEAEDDDSEERGEAQADANGDSDTGPRKRRRRGRGRGRGGEARDASARGPRDNAQPAGDALGEHPIAHEDHDAGTPEEDGQPGADGAPVSAEGGDNGDGRRRRRRGRRGGRRNRHRDGDAPMQAGDEANNGDNGAGNDDDGDTDQEPLGTGIIEPELVKAVEDLDRPPAFTPSHASSNGYESAPAADGAATTPTSDQPQEPPRRRSTIREPAPVANNGITPAAASTLPTPTPVVVSTSNADAAPKRGWWGKRLLGDKS
jgi:ribonuclease E